MKLLFLTVALLLTAAGANGAGFDPSFRFRTIETEHFQVHYHQGLEALAARAAATAEEVHGRLSPLLGWQPAEKTNLVLADNSDFANGMATAIPWNTIYLQTVPPATDSTIGEYDDWLRTLLIHEYAHILTSDPVRGYSRLMRSVFGKPLPVGDIPSLLFFLITAPPNVLMPGWWHEGMATWSETELTGAGRGRSSFYEMIFRTAVAERNLPTIDLINGDVPYWPAGNLPYIFGSRLVQYEASVYGSDLPGKISVQQSGRPPFLINGPPESRLGGRNYPALYREMLADLTREQQARIAALGSTPFTETARLSIEEAWDTSPRFSPDGNRLAFNRDDRHNHRQIVITDLHGKKIASLRRQYGDGSISWSPDAGQIYFSQAELEKNVNTYRDIYRYDLKTDRTTRITFGARAADPDVSPDGNTLVMTVTGKGNQNLALLDIGTAADGAVAATPRMLTDYREFRVEAPRWSPDGKSIAFTVTDNSGAGSLHLLNPASGEDRTLFTVRHTVAFPCWSRDGKRILYTSDESGVFNIHSWSLADGSRIQETHLLSGGFSPDTAPDGTVAVSLYTSRGFRVASIAADRLLSGVTRPPPLGGLRYPVNPENLTGTDPQGSNGSQPASTPYSPWASLAPRFWLPALIADGADDLVPGIMTAGQDILGYHTILGSAWYGAGYRKAYYDATYRYGRFTPTLTLHGYALPSTYTNLLYRGDYTELERGLIAELSLPVKKLESGFSLTAGYHLRDQQHLSPLSGGLFNGLDIFQGRRDSFFAGFDYTGSLRYPWSVSQEEGRNISARVNYYGKASGSDIDSREYTLSWQEHLPVYRHHALFLRLNCGMAEGERTPQQAFQLGGQTSEANPFGLRGYGTRFQTGNYAVAGTVEYRFPVWYLLSGIATWPLFFDRLHGALFADAGEVWDRDRSFRGDRVMIGAGGELRLDLTVGYWLKVTPAIGYAHGFDSRYGEDRLLISIRTNL